MSTPFQSKARFTSKDEIYHFNAAGKLEKTTTFTPPICPICRRHEHNYELGKITIWSCGNKACLDSRIDNAGANSMTYPINFIAQLRKRNQFSNAKLEKDGMVNDFVEKWELLKEGKIKDIILQGDLGVGKTYSMYAALHEVCRLRPQAQVLFMTETELYERIKDTWEKDSKVSEKIALEKISNVEFLFLDDLGSATRSNQGDWSKQILLEILDERLNSYTHYTIISSNFIMADLLNIYGGRIADRLKLMTTAFLQGESRRKPFQQPPETTETPQG